MINSRLSRRAFLAATTTTTAFALGDTGATQPNTARVVPKKYSPNQRLNIAAIGAGGKGLSDIMSCHALGENIVALCDVDWNRAGEAFYSLPDSKQFKDFRKMLESMPEIDAVTISTPDHTHAPAAYMAMNLGKHVFVQKPMAHTVAETRLLTEVARKTGTVTQMGNQGNSGNGTRELCEIVWSGDIGAVRKVHAWTNRPIWPQGMTEALEGQPVPDSLYWDGWIGPAPMRPYNPMYAPFNWRGWWDFGCGALGDMACHILDTPCLALKLHEAAWYTAEALHDGATAQSPPRWSIVKYTFPARGPMPPVELYWYDGKLLPPRPEGVPPEEKLGDGNHGSIFYGDAGIVTTGTSGEDTRLLPGAAMAAYKRPDPYIPRVEGENHFKNWIDGIKGGPKPGTNFDYAGPLTEMVLFGNLAIRTGKKLHWDNVKGEVTNHKDFAALLSKEYRKGWELPC